MLEIVSRPKTSASVTVPTAKFSPLRRELLNRGKKLQKEARVYLYCVAGALLAGLLGIVFAAYLPRFDLQVQQTTATQELINTKQEEITAISGRLLVPRESTLIGIELNNNGRGIAVGRNGTVLTTDNAGFAWIERDSGTDATLVGIALTNDGRGIAVGDGGTVLTTGNAGATWDRNEPRWMMDFMGVALIDDGRGIAVGNNGTLLILKDLDSLWIEQSSRRIADLTDIALTNNGRGIAVGRNGTVFTTDDTGVTWIERISGTQADLMGIALTNNGRGIAVGRNGTVFTTDDTGVTWIERISGTQADLMGIALTNNGRGIAVGRNGTVFTTDDTGVTWIERISGTQADLMGIALTGDGRGIAVGTSIGITTTDSGANWIKHISSREEARAERETLLQEIRDLEVGGIGRTDRPPERLQQPSRASEELMRTGPIRLAIVVLLLFLVQVLVGLNRYNTRLAAFYLARADTLLLLPDSTDQTPLDAVERVTQLLSPDQLDFGRTPKAVAQHAVELVRALSPGRSPQNRPA